MSNDLFIFLYTRNGYKYCNIPAMLEQYSRIIGLESIGWEKSNTKIEWIDNRNNFSTKIINNDRYIRVE